MLLLVVLYGCETWSLTIKEERRLPVGADKSLVRPGRKQATGPNSGLIQHTPHEAQYTTWPIALTCKSHSKII